MSIKVGERLPQAKFRVMTAEGPAWKSTDDIFKGKKVALFAVPGAFTSTCHKMHVPSIVQNADALKAKGVNTVAVTSVNDVFVMDAFGTAHRAQASTHGVIRFAPVACGGQPAWRSPYRRDQALCRYVGEVVD